MKSHQINGVMATDPTRSTVYWHAFADPNMSGLNVATGKNEPVCPIPAGSRVGGSLVHDSREGKDHLYWAGIDEQERWIVARCEVGAETSEILATLASEAKPELAIAGEHLYWVDDSHDDSGLRRIPLDGGDMEMLDPDASRPIHSTGDAVYYAGWDGEVRKLGAGQSCPVVLAAVESKYHTLSAFTSDDSKLYGIATDGQMFAVSR